MSTSESKWLLNGSLSTRARRYSGRCSITAWAPQARRPTFCLAHIAYAWRSSPFWVLDIFLCLNILCVLVFFVGLAKLHCGATPPSVMVLFTLYVGIFVKEYKIVNQNFWLAWTVKRKTTLSPLPLALGNGNQPYKLHIYYLFILQHLMPEKSE